MNQKKAWSNMTSAEKNLTFAELNDTYRFDNVTDTYEVVDNLLLGYDADPPWFDFVIDDKQAFADELAQLIIRYKKMHLVDAEIERVRAIVNAT